MFVETQELGVETSWGEHKSMALHLKRPGAISVQGVLCRVVGIKVQMWGA